MLAFGGGNDHDLESKKAGPGTIYLLEGKNPKLVHSLIVTGDVDNSVQNQTYVYISGSSPVEFDYDVLKLTGKTPHFLPCLCKILLCYNIDF